MNFLGFVIGIAMIMVACYRLGLVKAIQIKVDNASAPAYMIPLSNYWEQRGVSVAPVVLGVLAIGLGLRDGFANFLGLWLFLVPLVGLILEIWSVHRWLDRPLDKPRQPTLLKLVPRSGR